MAATLLSRAGMQDVSGSREVKRGAYAKGQSNTIRASIMHYKDAMDESDSLLFKV